MQNRYRLARVQHCFLQHIKFLIGCVIKQPLARGQIANGSASCGHAVAHIHSARNGLDIRLGAQNIFIIIAHLIAI